MKKKMMTTKKQATMEELWRAYKYDDSEDAREELITQCMPLLKSAAHRLKMYASPSHDIDDLASMGIMGLLDAVEKYNPSKGAAFKTYAAYRIRGAILDEVRALDWVPRSVRDKSTKLSRAYQRLQQETGEHPDEVAVAKELGMSVSQVQTALQEVSCVSMLNLDELCTDEDEENSVKEFLEDPNNVSIEDRLTYEETRNMLAKAIEQLPDTEKLVVSLYYNEELTMKEVGLVLNLGESRVSQLHSSAIIRLRNTMKKLQN